MTKAATIRCSHRTPLSSQQRDQADAAAKGLAATVAADRPRWDVAALNLGYTQIAFAHRRQDRTDPYSAGKSD